MTLKASNRRRTIRRLFIAGSVGVAALPCIGATAEIRVVFPDEAERHQWLLAEEPDELPSEGREFNSKEILVPVPKGFEKGTIVIVEPKTGNVVLKKVDAIDEGVWTVAEGEWRVAQVNVKVQQGAAPLAVGVLEAKWETGVRSAIVKDGKATLFAIPPGEVILTLRYGEIGAEKTSTEVINLSLKRDKPVSEIEIAVPGAPPPVAKEKAEEKTKAEKPEVKPEVAGWRKLIVWVIAILIGVGALFFLVNFLKKHHAKVTARLQALGIQIPDAAQDKKEQDTVQATLPPLVEEGHCPYCGNPLAPDGSCQCRSLTVAADAKSVALAVARLVQEGGPVIEIREGTSVLGRDPAVDLLVAHQTVSRRHAEVRKQGSKVFLVDMGSSNGTFVNGRKIDSEVELRPGDAVQFGAVRMRFEA